MCRIVCKCCHLHCSSSHRIITHDCLNQNLLVLADGTTRYKGPLNAKKLYVVKARLPAGLTCSQCVLQWKYHAGKYQQGLVQDFRKGLVLPVIIIY